MRLSPNGVFAYRSGALLGKLLVVVVTADAIRAVFDSQLSNRDDWRRFQPPWPVSPKRIHAHRAVPAIEGFTPLPQPAPASATEKSGDRTDNTGKAQAAN
jgi:hypothetical protein